MDHRQAERELAARRRTRATLIEDHLRRGEMVLDCGDVNELSQNTLSNLAAGEGLLFITDQRLIFRRSARLECWDYGEIRGFRLKRAPRGVPQRRFCRELTLDLEGGEERSLIGGRMFMAEVTEAIRAGALRDAPHAPSRNPKPNRESLIRWCARQFARRMESVEAHSVALLASDAGMAPAMVMAKMLTSSWPTVIAEAQHAHPRNRDDLVEISEARDALQEAMKAGIPALFLGHSLLGRADELLADSMSALDLGGVEDGRS